MVIKKFIKKFLPMALIREVGNFKILAVDYGQYRTMKRMACVDKNGKGMPWYTYPAIEYLKQLDFSGKTVFEYGSGSSSGWWSGVAKKIVSVEHDEKWFNIVNSSKNNNQEIYFCKTKDKYVSAISASGSTYDVVIVDGAYRQECAGMAVNYLKPGGLIIFDNSDWYPGCCEYLRGKKLIEVDFFGFGPINHYTWCTSLFFSRDANFFPTDKTQPKHSIGSLGIIDKSEM